MDSTISGEDWYARDIGKETFTAVAFIDVDFTERWEPCSKAAHSQT